VHPDEVAFCARLTGRVIATSTKHSGEAHLLVSGGLHLTIVEVPAGRPVPGWGSWVTAVGPLLADQNGLRELLAVQVADG
jgi:hypothetical protein